MTQNTVSQIASTPFCGLATQTFNVPTTGLWTVGAIALPPWMTSDQPQAVANPTVNDVENIATVADVAGSLNSTFWKFWLAGNLPFLVSGTWYQFFYVWNNINGAGVDPAPAGGFGIAVAGATGVTANTLAAAARTAIAAAMPATGTSVIVSGATNHIILTQNQPGALTAAVDGSAPTGFTFSQTTAGSFGYASGLVLTLKKNATIIGAVGQPTPTQPIMNVTVQVSATAGDTFSVITSSLAAADAGANSVKGVINIFPGPV